MTELELPKYKSNLNIFFYHNYLEDNVATTSTLTLDEITYEQVDVWEVVAEFIDENTNEIVCGIYISHDPQIDFYMVVLNGIPHTFKGEKGRLEAEALLAENGYTYQENQEKLETVNAN